MTLDPVTLADLVEAGVGHVVGDSCEDPRQIVVTGVQHDSRRVAAGDVFVAIAGESADGSAFAAAAAERGAVAVATERELPSSVPQIIVPNARRALGQVAAVVFADPTASIRTVGITGTNGKTTTAWLLESALAGAGAVPAVMGTVVFRGPGIEQEAVHTTPEGDDIARFAREVLDHGATHLVMEVSSHGLALHRVDAVHFEVAVFTNLSRDHLDFHGSEEEYAAAKRRLFFELGAKTAVVNIDDPEGRRIADLLALQEETRLLRCSTRSDGDAEIRVERADLGRAGIRCQLATPAGSVNLVSPLVGAHNLENLLVVVGAAVALDIPLDAVATALRTCAGAPGRLERISDTRGVAVFVDYAHTPDALERALVALRTLTPGRLIVVFGCGGDRDRGKRPQMGQVAAEVADLCIVTSDNPRTERPGEIIDAVLVGVVRTDKQSVGSADVGAVTSGYVTVEDRRAAIVLAISAAKAGDTVLVAGKGHETYQILGTERVAFDDRVIARAAIADAGGAA